ncbi:hypothetical protein VPHF86_0297 [Vibrio phage F86]
MLYSRHYLLIDMLCIIYADSSCAVNCLLMI